jgi:hypothetical protein
MSRWPNGSGEIEHLLARRLDTAKAIVVDDPESADCLGMISE